MYPSFSYSVVLCMPIRLSTHINQDPIEEPLQQALCFLTQRHHGTDILIWPDHNYGPFLPTHASLLVYLPKTETIAFLIRKGFLVILDS